MAEWSDPFVKPGTAEDLGSNHRYSRFFRKKDFINSVKCRGGWVWAQQCSTAYRKLNWHCFELYRSRLKQNHIGAIEAKIDEDDETWCCFLVSLKIHNYFIYQE